VRIAAVNIRIFDDQSGSVAVLFGLVLVPLFFLGGAAIDYSAASGARAQVQRTLDEAVLAGAAAPSDQTGIAAKAFDSSIGAPKAYVTKVQFQIQNGLLTGDATASVPTSFMRSGGTALSTISIGAHAWRAQAPGGTCASCCSDRAKPLSPSARTQPSTRPDVRSM
jgi:Flp pilus assembly protein TadG